ncbi:hypothetical protein DNU06_04950 [Putridiphycobacter roseus]|uniref:Acyloxyacyl hydrolase n=1 Tax=Putridiphycobacter roseus TaxID=2219161 RepID=A0A2W1N0B4_9FLAO|nr:hypothetical protein DNU06_04950 [Putridiphycobacter roseus]
MGLGQANKNIGYYAQVKGSFLMAHRSAMSHLVKENAYGFEIGIIKHLQSSINDPQYRFPAIGLNLEYRNFGYDAVLGKALSMSHFYNLPFYQKKDFFIDFQFGTGIGYITKKFDLDNNLTNNAIGSHFNAKVTLKLLFTKYINRINFGGGLELSHYSNGAITYPNLGLNLPAVFVQIGFLPAGRKAFQKDGHYEEDVFKKYFKMKVLVSAIFSVKQVGANPYLPKRYPVFGVRGTFQKKISKLWFADFSVDVIQNEANVHVYPYADYSQADALQIGLYVGAAYTFYKSEIVFGLGYYVRDKINPLGKVYNKIGYRYHLNSNWYGLFNVRANLGKADFFEFGIGYQLKKW